MLLRYRQSLCPHDPFPLIQQNEHVLTFCTSRMATVICNVLLESFCSNCHTLSTLVVVTDTDSALVGETVGPEAADVDVDLWGTAVGEEQPSTEDWLSEDVQNGVGDDLLIDVHLAATVGHTPNTVTGVSLYVRSEKRQ